MENLLMNDSNDRSQWKSSYGFLLAAVGSAVGLGNIWRFSFLCHKNGGGAFLIPYFVALFIVGIPLLVLEFALGHKKQGSAPAALEKVGKEWEWLGWWPVIFVMFGIVLYYNVIIGWCVNYMMMAFRSIWSGFPWAEDSQSFFYNDFLALSDTVWSLGSLRWQILLATILVWVVNWSICFRHVEKGVEAACKIFMPLLLLLTLTLVFWSLTLPGAMQGVKAYLYPDWTLLSKKQVWQDAFGQIFFSLSLGFGIMIAYASYLPRKVNIIRYALITSLADTLYSFVAGFAVFSILGYMAQEIGATVHGVVTEGPGLAFVVYPKALTLMGNLTGGLLGTIFFLTLCVAGLSSSISIIEAFTAAALDKFKIVRARLVTITCSIGFVGSLVFCSRAGLFWLDIVDHFLNGYGLMTVGLVECLLVGWYYEHGRMRDHLGQSSGKPIGALVASWWDWSIKFIAPGSLFLIIFWSLRGEISHPYGGYPVSAVVIIGGGWVLLTHFAAVFFSHLKWKLR